MCVAAVTNNPTACTHMPVTIKPLRPQRSLNGPVTVWSTPHTAGYTALRMPMRSTLEPEGGEEEGEYAPAHPVI